MASARNGNNKVIVGNLTDINGEINIAAGDIYKGYTAEQVSVLITQITSNFQPKPFDGRCPYKGLNYFEENDAELFYGRERLIKDLLTRVNESRTVFITGPSGSGKSSLVRAGLIPALKQGALPGSENWLYATMKPGREPIAELARISSRLAKSTNAEDEICTRALTDPTIFARWCEIALEEGNDKRVVLFLDQFEELFTQISKETERVAFLNLLTHPGTSKNGRITLLFAMRSDFLSNCAPYPGLNALLGQQFIQVGAMQPDELVSAIAQPALHVGLRVDPDLIAQIINDMKGEPGALPLMQFALKDLFDSQQEKGGLIELTLEEYLDQGGIHKALERHADNSFSQLNETEQQLARFIFGKLIEIGRGTQDTRRTALLDELIPADTNAQDVSDIVRKLADARLIITDEQAGKDTVTISHEKLIDAWPWLRKLVNENREVIALQNEITEDAKEWDDHQRDPSYLYTGLRLTTAHDRLNTKQLILSGTAHEFIQASIITFTKEQTRKKRSQKQIIVGLSGFTVSIFILLVFALIQLNISRAFQLAALAQAAFTEGNYNLSALYAYQSNQIHTNEPASHLLGNLPYENFSLGKGLLGYSALVISVAWSPDGRLASGSRDNTVTLWDLDTGMPAQTLNGHTDAVYSVAWSTDGRLASGSWDKTVIIWDLDTGKPAQTLKGHTDAVNSVAWSSDGRLASGSRDGALIIWDLDTGKPAQTLKGHIDGVNSVAWSADGRLASGSYDDTVILWDLTTGQPAQTLKGHTDSVNSVAWSSDGRLASGSYDNTIILWDLVTNKPAQILKGHGNWVNGVAWSSDGRLATSSGDNTVILWDLTTGQPAQTLKGHTYPVNSVAWSSDGRLASGSNDHTVILWDITTSKPAQTLKGQKGRISSVVWSADGDLASGADDGAVTLWDLTTSRPGQTLKGPANSVKSVAWSVDGHLASGSNDHTVSIWNLATGQPAQILKGHGYGVSSVAWSANGQLASGSYDHTVIIWNLATGQPAQILKGHGDGVSSVAWSADGQLASGSWDKTVIIWDLGTGKPSQVLNGHTNRVNSVAWSSDGRLASSSDDRTIILWDLAIGRPAQTLKGHSVSVLSVAWSADGRLASGSRDHSVILWNLTTSQPTQILKGHTEDVYSVTWSADGRLASGADDNTIKISRADITGSEPCNWIYRNMTIEEWITTQGVLYVYEPACPSLSIPTMDPVEAYSKDGPYYALLYALITWKGRLALLGIAIMIIMVLAIILRGLYKVAIYLQHRFSKRPRKAPSLV